MKGIYPIAYPGNNAIYGQCPYDQLKVGSESQFPKQSFSAISLQNCPNKQATNGDFPCPLQFMSWPQFSFCYVVICDKFYSRLEDFVPTCFWRG